MVETLVLSLLVLLPGVPALAQEDTQGELFELKGTVTSSDAEPLAGAGVFVKGRPGAGAVTDIDGKFSIRVAKKEKISASFIGFAPFETTVRDESPLEIVLMPDSEFLAETVVVGYGTQKKVNLTGAVAVVDGDALSSRSASSVGEPE